MNEKKQKEIKKKKMLSLEKDVLEVDFQEKKIKNDSRTTRVIAWWNGLTQKKKIVYLSFVVLSVFALIVFSSLLFKAFGLGKWDKESPVDHQPVSVLESNEEKVEPKNYESPLTGKLVTKTVYDQIVQKRPLAIVVENHIDARPQSGLNEADIVWEALAEGGISRFMPIYLENQPDKVGPVRSLRKYYLDWVSELRDGLVMHIAYAHTDNPETNALGYIYIYDIKSLSLFAPQSFWREKKRDAPHNAYSSTQVLWQRAEDKNWIGIVDLQKWQFKEDQKQESRGDVSKISYNWQGEVKTDYSAEWDFDSKNNHYLRTHNGKLHIDEDTKDQIFARNLVLQIVPARYTIDTDGKSRLIYDLIGEGEVYVLLDGDKIEGKWKKADRISRTKYFNSEDKEIKFNRGRTWIAVLPSGSKWSF